MVSTCIVNFGISFCGTTTSHTQLRRSGPPYNFRGMNPRSRELIPFNTINPPTCVLSYLQENGDPELCPFSSWT